MGLNQRVSSRSTLSSVTNALVLLGHFKDHVSVSVSEAADLLGVSPSSAHRTLATLRDNGFLRQRSGRRYEAGPMLVEIALGALAQTGLRDVADPHLRELSRTVPAQIWLNKLADRRVHNLGMHIGIGVALAELHAVSRYPIHTSASGKLLLSHLAPSHIDSLYPDAVLETVTARSLRRKEQLLEELELIRRCGYAVQVGEQREETAGVAVPLYGVADEILGVLAVTGPADEFDSDTRRSHLVRARSTARAISRDVRGWIRELRWPRPVTA
jgi:DNA-binding IclR family transcriptional regulator